MKLMQNSGVPIYQQIADSFKTDILAGRYEQGEFLPSIRGPEQRKWPEEAAVHRDWRTGS